jgi:hypothetical protein
MNFDHNIPLFLYRILPPPLRTAFWRSWLQVLLHPVEAVKADFAATRTRLLRQVSFNGQTIVLERCLNLEFYSNWSAVAPNPIWIENLNAARVVTYFYYTAEEEMVDVPIYYNSELEAPLYLYRGNEAAGGDFDFIVHHPAALTADQRNRLTYLVNLYRIAPKRFTLQPY